MFFYGLRQGFNLVSRQHILLQYTLSRELETGFIGQGRFRNYLQSVISEMAERFPKEKALPEKVIPEKTVPGSIDDKEEKIRNKKKKKPNKKTVKKNEIGENESENQNTYENKQQGKKKKKPKPKQQQQQQGSNNKKQTVSTSSEQLPDYLLTANPSGSGKPGSVVERQNNARSPANKNTNKKRNKLPAINFEQYMSFEKCSEGLKKEELIQGSLRINPRNFNDGYISSLGGSERDIYLEGVVSRNRSFPGDIVAVQILPKENWKSSQPGASAKLLENEEKVPEPIKTGKVVRIIEKKHPRVACGFLKPYQNNKYGFALLSPVDNRLPRLMIPLNECPEGFINNPSSFEKILFLANIHDWSVKSAFAAGKLMRSLGEAGHIEPETEAILTSNDIDSSPFSQDVVQCLPDGDTWSITEGELSKRLDLRNKCIFTIDPATARDLDDALSCEEIGDNTFEVGVHIADVSNFVLEGTALDEEAKKRATSVYLAQKVVPMLPSVLCEKLCSLNPGVERLAYSVIWKLRSDGTVLSERFERSVIRSCVKLSYDHAQKMIDEKDFMLNATDFPKIFHFDLEKISTTVKLLYGISKHLRQRRFDSGALRLDQPKLAFTLDGKTGMPNGCHVHEYKDSNRMIEEFMLLANMAVGHRIYKAQPEKAILRSHPPPQEIMLKDVEDICRKFEIPFDTSDSTSISKSLSLIEELDNEKQSAILPALTLLCTKPFQNAKYFCTGTNKEESTYRHYALNVPIYTHFTSPIRRYPDVMVHRSLTAALDKTFNVTSKIEGLQSTADHCNDKKWAAKKASEQSIQLFFAVYLLEGGPLTEKGVVVGVLDKAIDVLCRRVGTVVRIYFDKLPLWKYELTMDGVKPLVTIVWKDKEKEDIEAPKAKGEIEDQLKALTKRFEKKWETQREKAEHPEQVVIPGDAVVQQLTFFTEVDVVLSVNKEQPTKILGHLNNPSADDKMPAMQL